MSLLRQILSSAMLLLLVAACGTGTVAREPPPDTTPFSIELTIPSSRISADDGVSAVLATVRNVDDKPLAGLPVQITSDLGTVEPVVDKGDGTYATQVSGLIRPGRFALTATLGTITVTLFANVTVGRLSTDTSTFTVDSNGTADGILPVTALVRLFDKHGNPLDVDQQVTVTATGAAVVGNVLWNSDSDGHQAAITDTTAETVTVTATVGGVMVGSPKEVTFAAPSYRVELTPSVTVVDAGMNVRLTAAVSQVEGSRPLKGRTVTLESPSSTAKFSVTTMEDQGDGTYVATVTETVAGTLQVVVHDDASGATDAVDVTVHAQLPASIGLQLSAASISADVGAVNATLVVRDAYGNLANAVVESDLKLAWTPGLPGLMATCSAAIAGNDGSYQIACTELRVPGHYQVTPLYGNGISGTPVDLDITPGAPAHITNAAVSGALNADVGTGTVSFNVTDAFGNLLSGLAPTAKLSGGVSGAKVSAVVDDSGGAYHANLTGLRKANAIGALKWTVTIKVGSVTAVPIDFIVSPGAPVFSKSFTLDTSFIGADTGSSVGEFTMRDQYDNEISGLDTSAFTAVWGPTQPGSQFSCATTEIEPPGFYRVTCTGLRKAGSYQTLMAFNGLPQTPPANLKVVGGKAVEVTELMVSGALNADAGTGTISFRLMDAFGNGSSESPSSYWLSGGNPDAVVDPLVNDSDGRFHLDVRNMRKASSHGANWNVTVFAGTPLEASTTFTLAPGAPVVVQNFALTPASLSADDGQVAGSISLVDLYGNPLTALSAGSLQLEWSPSNSASCVWTETSTSGRYDIACSNVRQAGTFTVIAKVNGQVASSAATVTVTAGASTVVTTPTVTSNIDADSGAGTVSFRITDASGNPLSGRMPTLTLTGGNPEATVGTIVENNGTYSAPLTKLWLASSEAGANWQITASLNALTSAPCAFTVEAGAAVLSTTTLSGDTSVPVGTIATTYLTMRDQRGNIALPSFEAVVDVQADHPGCLLSSTGDRTSTRRLMRQVTSASESSCTLTFALSLKGSTVSIPESRTVTFTGGVPSGCPESIAATACQGSSEVVMDADHCALPRCLPIECQAPTTLNCGASCPTAFSTTLDESTGCLTCLCLGQ